MYLREKQVHGVWKVICLAKLIVSLANKDQSSENYIKILEVLTNEIASHLSIRTVPASDRGLWSS